MGWNSVFDERQQKEIDLARVYERDFKHGTDGHHRLLVIAKMAGLLDKLEDGSPPDPIEEPAKILKVPYHSQHEADAQWFRKDCGPACTEMVGKYYQWTADATTNEIMQFITKGADRSTYIRELQRACEHFFGVELIRFDGADYDDLKIWVVNERRPCIVLVHYGSFAIRMDRRYTGGHYLVVVGFDEIEYGGETIERVIVHDPDFYGSQISQGAFIPVTKPHFLGTWDDAWKDQNPRKMALVARAKG